MKAQDIENLLNRLKVDELGRIRGKSVVMNGIQSRHLQDMDKSLMDIRVFVARLSTAYGAEKCLKMIDEFIYQKQIKP